MGMFDTVKCEFKLPNPLHQDLEFQTKDLECVLDDYTITRDGRLVRHPRHGTRGPVRDVEWPVHGDIRIYGGDPGNERRLVEYVVRFTHGRVEWVRALGEEGDADFLRGERDQGFPQFEGDEAHDEAGPAGEAREASDRSDRRGEAGLLTSLRLYLGELEALLERSSDHWGFEDPVYRFYHQSFKVYGLQEQTKAIVGLLASLAPDRPLNPRFVEIVEAGTGKEFQPEDNARWTRVTRPILEAFFHARFFLEMAVRYAHLDRPPDPLPSGYAALLYLYDLR